ncbi:MAG: hypothetical protein GYB67_14250, partial [Chloroflexi bacterium]|nr:hypothetical protein [Chloroflexota bacterium]
MRIRVEGRCALNGVYRPSGNGNAAQALLAAALLTDAPITLRNIPRTLSTQAMLDLAERLGAQLTWLGAQAVTVTAPQLAQRKLTQVDTASVAALLFAAPILVRRQFARIEFDFPLNRIRTHLEALRDLGIDVVNSSGAVELRAATWGRREVWLTQASVTATAIVMMLAARLGKETIVRHAACEPHLQDLAALLVAMGARIEGAGSNVLHIYGTDALGGADVTVGPDHIETASIAAIAAMSGGRVRIDGIRRANLGLIAKIYWRLGISMDMDEATAFIPRHEALTVSNREEDVDSSVETAPWPGFPSDLVALATVFATQARGTSLIHEKLFNNRLLFVDKLMA